jgi:hypothetical protein
MKKIKTYFGVEIPPSQKIGFSKRSRYFIIRTTSIKKAFKIITRELLKAKRAFNKEKIKDNYYYYDGAIYIERMGKTKKSELVANTKIIHTGYFLELCRECIYSSTMKHKKKNKKNKE